MTKKAIGCKITHVIFPKMTHDHMRVKGCYSLSIHNSVFLLPSLPPSASDLFFFFIFLTSYSLCCFCWKKYSINISVWLKSIMQVGPRYLTKQKRHVETDFPFLMYIFYLCALIIEKGAVLVTYCYSGSSSMIIMPRFCQMSFKVLMKWWSCQIFLKYVSRNICYVHLKLLIVF